MYLFFLFSNFSSDNTNHSEIPVPSVDLEMSQQSFEEKHNTAVPESNFNHLVESDDNKESKPKMWDKNRANFFCSVDKFSVVIKNFFFEDFKLNFILPHCTATRKTFSEKVI